MIDQVQASINKVINLQKTPTAGFSKKSRPEKHLPSFPSTQRALLATQPVQLTNQHLCTSMELEKGEVHAPD